MSEEGWRPIIENLVATVRHLMGSLEAINETIGLLLGTSKEVREHIKILDARIAKLERGGK
jgi:prefoldin subunit 5